MRKMERTKKLYKRKTRRAKGQTLTSFFESNHFYDGEVTPEKVAEVHLELERIPYVTKNREKDIKKRTDLLTCLREIFFILYVHKMQFKVTERDPGVVKIEYGYKNYSHVIALVHEQNFVTHNSAETLDPKQLILEGLQS